MEYDGPYEDLTKVSLLFATPMTRETSQGEFMDTKVGNFKTWKSSVKTVAEACGCLSFSVMILSEEDLETLKEKAYSQYKTEDLKEKDLDKVIVVSFNDELDSGMFRALAAKTGNDR